MRKYKQYPKFEFYSSMESVITKTVKLMENQVCEYDNDNFLKSGIQKLDFFNGDFSILCARSGRGKTAFALNILNNLAVKNQIPAGYISCGDIDTKGFGKRLISLNSKIPYIKLRNMMLNREDFKKCQKVCGKLYHSPLYFTDLPNPSFDDVLESCYYMKREQNVKFIAVDSLDYFQEILDSKDEDFRENFEHLLDNLKRLVKDLKIPILILIDIPYFGNRENDSNLFKGDVFNEDFYEHEYFKKYEIIQRKADILMFLKYEDNYDHYETLMTDKFGQDLDISLQIIKNNHGTTSTINLEFHPQTMKFFEKNNS